MAVAAMCAGRVSGSLPRACRTGTVYGRRRTNPSRIPLRVHAPLAALCAAQADGNQGFHSRCVTSVSEAIQVDGVTTSARSPSLSRLCDLAAEVVSTRGDMLDVDAEEMRDPAHYAFQSAYKKDDREGGGRCGFSNWLVRDVVMVGRYPFCDPTKGGPSEQESRAHLRRVLQAGVTTFVCLQDELPPQDISAPAAWPQSGISLRDHPSFLTWTDDAYEMRFPNNFLPYGTAVVEECESLGVSKIPEFLYYPIEDMSVPESIQLCCILEELLTRLQEDASACLYVHCWGGRGRAGVVGACMLALLRPSLTPAEVLSYTQIGYSSREDSVGAYVNTQSPQTPEQRAFVHDFATRLRSPKSARATEEVRRLNLDSSTSRGVVRKALGQRVAERRRGLPNLRREAHGSS
eukprot:gnl/TRDRNA2_/TRDRNA2_89248_c0_seq1.p1 gnl/TRDRNA2_/TRDRNA2_89248_c0~~gnl/TRDRNA2_/TRDRNA2_89248_c0_seq1.p1  ORF type:complete len:405 (-),score=48.52 gnl/TRDRNA2_/TRDRNA2_89248_c0_seq1:71-1285(-)